MPVDDPETQLSERVRAACAEIAATARYVTIDLDHLDDIEPAPPPRLDPEEYLLEGSHEEIAMFTLALDAINFGSGWFPTLRKRPGRSGARTIAAALTEHAHAAGAPTAGWLRDVDTDRIARILGQDAGHELMTLYARGLRDLGMFLGERSALELIDAADGSAQRLAAALANGMELFDDVGFYKRAQITASDLALAGVSDFYDLDRLTIFADNLVPHVLRVDGVLRYAPDLEATIDTERLLEPGEREREIRACAVHACELIAPRLGVAPRILDMWLWQRGQAPRYKAIPRHRTRTVAY